MRVREGKREREGERGREGGREGERGRMRVMTCVHVGICTRVLTPGVRVYVCVRVRERICVYVCECVIHTCMT